MKILLDECVTKHLKPYLPEHETSTVREMKWGGFKNGKLLGLCIEHGFELLLTIDKNLKNQQNLDKYSIIIVVFDSVSSKVEELILFLPSFHKQLPHFEKHKTYLIGKEEVS